MLKQMISNSYLFGGNMPFVEDLYENYINNPASVPDNWRSYFDSLQNLPGDGPDVAHSPIIASFAERAKQGVSRAAVSTVSDGRQIKVLQMITAYRFLGNRWAQLDPLKRAERPQIAELEPSFYGFTEADFGEVFKVMFIVAHRNYFESQSYFQIPKSQPAGKNYFCPVPPTSTAERLPFIIFCHVVNIRPL